MKTFGITLLATVALGLVAAKTSNDPPKPRGVSKSKAKLYTPDSAGRWTCLDGSKTISFQAVNDDYCDCPDGSDEPGTPACGTGYFYCQNVGHVPSYIRSSRVNDGVCDPECCDGTDEYDGRIQCANNCEVIGAKARAERERVNAIREKGAKLRQEYSDYGKKLKTDMEAQLVILKQKHEKVKASVETARDAMDKAQKARDKLAEDTKAERENARKAQLAPIIEEQEKRLERANEARDLLYKTLEDLQENHNKNFHDMAVKSTVTGFEEFIESFKKDSNEETTPAEATEAEEPSKMSPEDEYDALNDKINEVKREAGKLYDLLVEMKDNYNKEYNDPAVLAALEVTSQFATTWDAARNDFTDETALELPQEPLDHSPEAKAAREEFEDIQEAHNNAIAAESDIKIELDKIEHKLKLDLGKDEEFSKLVDQCFDYKTVEYTYQVCLFGSATQKSSGDTSLGSFSNWVGDDYTVQMYTGGLRCWNGPERSVKLIMSCGLENEIVSVTEPEKCEYLYEFRTPAVCKESNETDKAGEEDEDEDEDEDEAPMSDADQEHRRKHDEL
ncbi:hypothetical protein BGZ73_007811 [Actinomortierella ambigua]|nr:hypothetical protein BGZ73_007811 [Actinomortierella ambigua]